MKNHRKYLLRIIAISYLTCFLTISPSYLFAASTQDAQLALYENFAKDLVQDINQRSTLKLIEAINIKEILDEVFSQTEANSNYERDFRSSFNKHFREQGLPQIVQQIPQGGYILLLRVKPTDNGAKALIRFDYGDQGFGYLDFKLRTTLDQKIKIYDWYDFSIGQHYTEVLQQLVILTSGDTSILKRIFKILNNEKQQLQLTNLFAALKQQKYHEFFKIYDSLNNDIKKTKIIQLVSMQAANRSGDISLYKKALIDLEKYFGHDPSMAFLLIDYYFLEGRFTDAITALNKITEFIGVEDAALMTMRANAFIEAGKHEKGIIIANKGVTLEPSLETNYWALLMGYSINKDFKKAVDIAKTLEKNFSYIIDETTLADEDVYADLLNSTTFKSWQASKHIYETLQPIN